MPTANFSVILSDLCRRWMRQSEIGKGIRLGSEEMDALNAIGVGNLIAQRAAEVQQREVLSRMTGDQILEPEDAETLAQRETERVRLEARLARLKFK